MKVIRITCDSDLMLKPELIKPLQGKLKTLHKDQIKKAVKSIDQHGFSFPVFVWENKSQFYTVDGHQRLAVLGEMLKDGYELPDGKIPVVRIHAKDKKEAIKKVLLATSQYGRIQGDGLYELLEMEGIEAQEMLGMADFPEVDDAEFMKEFYEDETESDGSEDEVPEVQEEPKSKRGEIYQLDDHRLMCGDSTNIEDVEKLMDGQKADMVFTDPPYGVTQEKWDRKFTQDDLSMFFSITDGPILVWNATKPEIFRNMLNLKPICDRIAVWRMTSSIVGKGGMFWTWQPIYCWRSKDIKLWDAVEFESDMPTKTGDHPTQKPVGLICKWINACDKIKSVADLFLGSGSTLIACEKTGRKCYGMEIDPKYVDVIIKRWEDFTGKKATKMTQN